MDKQYYTTDNLGLAAFVALNGLKFKCMELCQDRGKKKAQIVFDDISGIGPSLEREFIGSREKMYRDLIFFFRNKIDETMRGV